MSSTAEEPFRADKDEIDWPTFEQILQMDEEDDPTREFSRSIVLDFFQQAESTFKQMDEELEQGPESDLLALSKLGHFLTGSAATLGLIKVRDGARIVQYLGERKNESGDMDSEDSSDEIVKKLQSRIQLLKRDYTSIEADLQRWIDSLPKPADE